MGGICFGGGYPACCQGKNTCGPLCASGNRVSEFLRMMMMFGGIGPGTPDVFGIINPDPHKDAGKDVSLPRCPFPCQRWGPAATWQAAEEPPISIECLDAEGVSNHGGLHVCV